MKNTNLSSKQNKLWISAVNDRAQLCPGQCKYRSEFPKSLQKCWVIFTINHMGLRDFKLFIVSWTIGTTRILSESERKSYKCYQHNQWTPEIFGKCLPWKSFYFYNTSTIYVCITQKSKKPVITLHFLLPSTVLIQLYFLNKFSSRHLVLKFHDIGRIFDHWRIVVGSDKIQL